MNKFSIRDCRILWKKEVRIRKRDKIAMKADLEAMSSTIEEAMIYTKDKLLKENRETQVKFWLNTETEISYYITIHYDKAIEAWHFSLLDENGEPVGEIVCKKWPSLQIARDEDVTVETF